MQIQHRHHSMRFDRSTATIEAVLKAARADCGVITGTEATRERWTEILQADGWETRHDVGPHSRGNPWVTWDSTVWEPRVGWVQELSEITYDGRRAHVAVQKLRHREAGTRVFFMAHHLPAHIQGDFFHQRLRFVRVRAYNDALSTLRDLVLKLREGHPNARFVVAGDWNLDFHKPWVPFRLGVQLRGTGLKAVPVEKGTPGTHGRRLIDWSLTDLEATGRVLGMTDASDHRPVALTYTIEPDDSPDTD